MKLLILVCCLIILKICEGKRCPGRGPSVGNSCGAICNYETGQWETKSCHGSGCFSGNSSVHLISGATKQIRDLTIGDHVLTEAGIYEPFIGWLDIMWDKDTHFLTLFTASLQSVTLTASHQIFVKKEENSKAITKYASEIQEGDLLINKYGDTEAVTKISISQESGYFNPLTESGTIVVDHFLTSCYGSYPHNLAHALLYPLRKLPYIFLTADEGTGMYIKMVKTIGNCLNVRNSD